MNFLYALFFCVVGIGQSFVADGAAPASTVAADSLDAAAKPTPLDDYASLVGQQITALNDKIKNKQVDVDAAQKQLTALDKVNPQYSIMQTILKQEKESLASLKDQLAEKTALQPAVAYQSDTLKKASAFMSDVESSQEDASTLAALLDNADIASNLPTATDVADDSSDKPEDKPAEKAAEKKTAVS
ncbi:MAG: hypothetical protein QG632_278 [Candidatus Dependentiae bacterium]|nr:hypothetical protein [Candidatus Dependentiae bacterium]